MKILLTNVILFIVLSFAFSSLTSCQSGPENTGQTTTDGSTEKKKVNYPPAPSVIMQSEIKMVDGTNFKLEDKKGKVILVNLWATWCGPCRAEMPHLVEMQDKYRDKNFEIIGLDVDPESKEDIEAFAKQMKLNYPLGWAAESLTGEFMKFSKQNGIPQSFLINREGQMTGVFFGANPKEIAKLKERVEIAVNEQP